MNSNFSYSSVENEINSKGFVAYTNQGDSMFPLIHPVGDVIVIKKPSFPLNKYQVPLYRRNSGKLVLHRIIAIKNDGSYIMRGDNRRSKEFGITDSEIIGVLDSVVRKGKEIKCTDRVFRIYSAFWCSIFVFRYPILFLRDVIKHVKKRVK